MSEKFIRVKLLKNHQPKPGAEYKVDGWLKPATKVKTAAGGWIETAPEVFIVDEVHPPSTPGVNIEGKLWAGTHVSFPIEYARELVKIKAAERADQF